MRLEKILLDFPPTTLPINVRDLLDDADDRVERFHFEHREKPIPAFVACDFVAAYHALRQITELNLSAGGRFCEWGSGIGSVTCLAALLGYDAIGIEIEPDLVETAISLADDHTIEAEFVHGSFVPQGGEECLDAHAYDLDREVTWLRSDGADAYEELGLDADDFDLVFAYPWPGEEAVIYDLFAEFAGVGALLLTHHGEEGLRLQRKVH